MLPIERDILLKKIKQLCKSTGQRSIVGIAGAPGSGKSTLAKWLVGSINRDAETKVSAILPQDGFHYDDSVLQKRNRLNYKGAPDTFDANGFYSLIQRALLEPELATPVFDRKLEISRNCAEIIPPETRVVIVEGNYLLLNAPENWSRLKQLFDLSVYIDVPIAVLERRLISRWRDHGYSQDEAYNKAFANDLPNARYVIENSAKADWIISQQ